MVKDQLARDYDEVCDKNKKFAMRLQEYARDKIDNSQGGDSGFDLLKKAGGSEVLGV